MNIGILDLVEFADYSDGPYIKDESSGKPGPRTLLFSARFEQVGWHFVHLLFCLLHRTLPARWNSSADGAASSFPPEDSGRTTYGVRMGLPSDERLFMTSVTCQACHKCFWTVNRLQIHLRQSRSLPGGCFERLTWTVAPLETACDIDPVEPALHHARLPAVTVPFATTWAAQSCLTRADADRQWVAAWTVTGLPLVLDDHVLTEFRSRFDHVLATYTQPAGPDPDPLLWALTQVADDSCDETPADLRAWALARWTLDDLRVPVFPTSRSCSLSESHVQ